MATSARLCLRAVPHITLKSIANNAEIDVIWEKWQAKLEPLRSRLNAALVRTGRNGKSRARQGRLARGREDVHAEWWQARIARQKEIDASIAAKGESEYLYDKPYRGQEEGPRRRPFHGREPSPHRVLGGR